MFWTKGIPTCRFMTQPGLTQERQPAPVMIDVHADGTKYQEMHVDGGAMAQIFIYPPALKLAELSAGRPASANGIFRSSSAQA